MRVSPTRAPALRFVVSFVLPELDPGDQQVNPGNPFNHPKSRALKLQARQFGCEEFATSAVHGGI
jgi:hypothetical protein